MKNQMKWPIVLNLLQIENLCVCDKILFSKSVTQKIKFQQFDMMCCTLCSQILG